MCNVFMYTLHVRSCWHKNINDYNCIDVCVPRIENTTDVVVSLALKQ